MSFAVRPDVIPFDSMPPANLDAELSVLGSMLLDNAAIDDVSPILRAEDFFRSTHGVLYRRIVAVRSEGGPVDALILLEHLIRSDELSQAGGEETIRQALDHPPHAANAVYYAQIVKQRATARNLIAASHETISESFSNLYSADQLQERAESRFYAIGDARSSNLTGELSEALDGALEALQRRGGGEVIGVSSGWHDLDALTDGFQPGTLTVIGARPSMGKTAFALNVCESNALGAGVLPYLVSLEMGKLEVANRLLQSCGRVDGFKIKSPFLASADEKARIMDAADLLRANSFPIDDSGIRTVTQIAANARRLKSRRGIGLIVVDYLQLLEGDDAKDSRQEQISKISRRLKTLARELHVPVIALSQLNRQVEGREDHRPRMSDLRESGAIEQDADVVILLHRPDYYDPNDQPGIAEAIVAKNRNGATDAVKLVFHKQFARFDSIAPPYCGQQF